MFQNGLELNPFLAGRNLVKGSCQSQSCLKNRVGVGGRWWDGRLCVCVCVCVCVLGGHLGQRIGFSRMLSSIQFPLDRAPLLHHRQQPFNFIVRLIWTILDQYLNNRNKCITTTTTTNSSQWMLKYCDHCDHVAVEP